MQKRSPVRQATRFEHLYYVVYCTLPSDEQNVHNTTRMRRTRRVVC